MDAIIPKRISSNWLRTRKTVLDCTAKDSPVRAELEAEIAAAEAEITRREQFDAWVRRELGLLLNQYPVRHGGQYHEPGQVFYRKDKATGQITLLSQAEAWERYQKAN